MYLAHHEPKSTNIIICITLYVRAAGHIKLATILHVTVLFDTLDYIASQHIESVTAEALQHEPGVKLQARAVAHCQAPECMLIACCRFYVTFHDDVRDSDSDSTDPKQKAASVSGLLERRIAAPLVRVQTALAKETVLWKRGILVMPKVCRCCLPVHFLSFHDVSGKH